MTRFTDAEHTLTLTDIPSLRLLIGRIHNHWAQ